MKASIIKSLSNKINTIEIAAGSPAYKTFPGVNFDNAVLIINGKKQTPDYIIKENDAVILRVMPADLTDTPWWVSTFFVPFGFIIQPAEIAYKARQQAAEAEKELEKIKKLTNAQIDNRPFLRGASNTIATGKSQPYFCGRNFNTPYLFSQPYYKISGTDGETQEVFNILECGFNGIVLNKLGIGDINIKTFSDDEPQNGAFDINDGVFATGKIEIRQDGELFEELPELNYKVVSNVINKEVSKKVKVDRGDEEYLIFDLDSNAKSVELSIKFPYGLYAYNNDNDKISTSVTITPEYSLDGGATYTPFNFDSGSNTFSKNTTKEIRYTAHHNFTLADYATLYGNGKKNILIRVRSNGNDDPKIKNDCYLFYYQSLIFDPNKSSAPAGVLNDGGTAGLVSCLNVEDRERGFCCVMGVRLKATKNNEQKLKQINIIATSTARTWNGTEWTEEKTPTRNPAAIAVEILTSPAHPASRYNDDELDLEAWGALYEKCENDGILFDYLITQNQKKRDTLEKIATVCNAAIYKDVYGRISVSIDQPQENAVAVYNPQNIIQITNKKTFSRRVDALRIKYIDSENDVFKENTYVVTRIENGQPVTIDENSIIKEVTATGITTFAQVVKYGRRLMAVDELRQIVTTIQIGLEGRYFAPFFKVAIQDQSLNHDTQDAVIESVEYFGGLLKKLILKNPVTFDPAKDYGVVINTVNDNGAHPLALKVSGTGTTRELAVLTEYRAAETAQPEKNNVLAFGELDENGEFSKVTHEFVISRISRNETGFNLELQEYNEAVYESGPIPAYKPIVNNTPTLEPGEVPIDAITSEQLEERIDRGNADTVQAAVDTITNGTRFTNIYNVRPVDLTLEEIVAKIDSESQKASASISISEDEILLKVTDMERELVGLIDIQAGSVKALVEGGGSTGEMSLSLNLPVLITEETRARMIAGSTEAKVNAVYGLIENTQNYGIKPGATSAAIKALWDDAVNAGLLASQIELNAHQIFLNGETIINDAQKIKAALIDVETLLGDNAFFTGEIWASETRFEKDMFFPIVELAQVYNNNVPGVINLETQTAEQIKTKLDTIINHQLSINIDYKDPSIKRAYVYIVSNIKEKKNVAPYSKASFYLQKYKNYETGITTYEIGSVSAWSIYGNNTRILLEEDENGVLTKYTSSTLSNELKFSYYAKELGVNGSCFFGGTIESRQGYQFYRPEPLLKQGYTFQNKISEWWNYCRMLQLNYNPRLCCIERYENPGVYDLATIWKESNNYIINIAGVQKYTLTENDETFSRILKIMI